MVSRLLLLSIFIFPFLATARPLESFFGQPSPAYFKRNSARYLDWILKNQPAVFRGTKTDFLATCLESIDQWTVSADNGNKLVSFSWRLPTNLTQRNDRFQCVNSKPLSPLAGANQFLQKNGIQLTPDQKTRWLGVIWDRQSKSWSALLREPNNGWKKVSRDKIATLLWSPLPDHTSLLKKLRFVDPSVVLSLQRDHSQTGVYLIDLASFHLFWAPTHLRGLIDEVHDEFGFPVREVEWSERGFMGVSLP